jgi:hypothetical protein
MELQRDFGEDNAVSWKLFENATEKTGVPSSLQGAIMLRRETMDPFKAVVTIRVKTDTIARLGAKLMSNLEGGTEKGKAGQHEILYDPFHSPTNRLCKYDVEDLGSVDLKSLSDVALRTVVEGTTEDA